MKLPSSWTTVTPLSKTIAMILFILLPFIGFSAGMRYQQKLHDLSDMRSVSSISPTPTNIPTTQISMTPIPSISMQQKICAQDARQCSDGTWVGRTGPACEFVCPRE